ncbi:DUF4956 domain-containing protein [candidate division KSB1 bacterium]|nr:DUF4956 domain-containing protein [candidate division KSB1 bacterium]
MLNDLNILNLFPLSGWDILRNFLLALACGLFIALIYRKSYRGAGYSANFYKSLILLTLITAMVLMVIGNNLARAFGLVGAMSIIRFRTAVKDTLDIVFIFFALAVGMAAGVGYHQIAILGTLCVSIIILVLSKSRLPYSAQQEILLQFTFMAPGNGEPEYLPVLQAHCRNHRVINVRTIGESESLELSFSVQLKRADGNVELVRALKRVEGVKNINLYFDDEEI